MTLSNHTRTFVTENISKMELTADGVNLQIDVHYTQDKCSVACETYIYDQVKKRYYRLVNARLFSGKKIKKRIGECEFHQVFELYLKRNRS